MKTKMIRVAFVAAIAMVSGINFFKAQNFMNLSKTALANVEALADPEHLVGGEGDFDLCEIYSGYSHTSQTISIMEEYTHIGNEMDRLVTTRIEECFANGNGTRKGGNGTYEIEIGRILVICTGLCKQN